MLSVKRQLIEALCGVLLASAIIGIVILLTSCAITTADRGEAADMETIAARLQERADYYAEYARRYREQAALSRANLWSVK